jgi:nucleotide-binding universal stress UspA family protein
MAVHDGRVDTQEPQSVHEPGAAMLDAWWKRSHDSRARRGKSERRVLFAASAFMRSQQALQRAYDLASRWHGTLYVLHVGRSEGSPREEGRHTLETERAIAQAALRSARRTADEGVAAELLPRDRMLFRSGEFAHVAAETARELGASLVIVAGAERRKGTAVAQLAREAGVPVLVARKAALNGGIVAATDFGDPGCDELRQAAALAPQVPGPLSFVHNVKPIVHAATTGLGVCVCTLIEPPAQALAEYRERLQALAAFFGVSADARVLSRPSAEDAILEIARERRADLVIVGTRKQRWLERLFGTTLAARIVDRCERSVLVAPLCERGVIGPAF